MPRLSLSIIAAFCSLSVALVPAGAQVVPALSPGARVRLVTPRLDESHQLVRILSSTPDSLTFRSEASPVTRTLAMSDLSAIEVQTSRGHPFGRYALIGAAVGGAAGAILGYAGHDEDCNGCFFETSAGEDAAFWGLFLAGTGSLIGLGKAAFKNVETWTRIPLRENVTIIPTASGRLAISMKFGL